MVKNFWAIAALAMIPSLSQAALTGNPLADGWVASGNSLSLGTYVRGTGGYSFTSYGAGFTLSSSSLYANWDKGDIIVGVGGTSTTLATDTNGSLIAKFGSTDATFSAATSVAAADGVGSTSKGGTGVVFVRAKIDATGSSLTFLTGADATNPTYGSFSNIDFLQGSWTYVGGVLTWEILLNVTRLQELYPNYASNSIAIGNKAIASYEASGYTDTLVTLSAPVPEPATTGLLATGLLGAWSLRRRR